MENWKPVSINGIDYKGLYEVSNNGNVRSLDRIVLDKNNKAITKKGKVLIPQLGANGYYNVGLCKEGKCKIVGVHQIVATAFIRASENNEVVHHKEGMSNCLSNLEIVTKRKNCSIEKTLKSGLPPGVWKKSDSVYTSIIKIKKKAIYLGRYSSPKLASQAYRIALDVIDSKEGYSIFDLIDKVNKYRISIDLKQIKCKRIDQRVEIVIRDLESKFPNKND